MRSLLLHLLIVGVLALDPLFCRVLAVCSDCVTELHQDAHHHHHGSEPCDRDEENSHQEDAHDCICKGAIVHRAGTGNNLSLSSWLWATHPCHDAPPAPDTVSVAADPSTEFVTVGARLRIRIQSLLT